jgi:broad specificity phosphatase PhoE
MPVEKSLTRFALIRHAETEWNREKLIQGQNDSPLTKYGEDKARKWGQFLKGNGLERIISSDSGRAMETASLINLSLNIPLISDPRLREQDWGLWTGMRLEEIKDKERETYGEQLKAGWAFKPPEGEYRHTVCERSCGALMRAGEKWPGEKILIVTHEGVIKCILSRLKDEQLLESRETALLSNHIHWVSCYKNDITLEKINALLLP